jgi:ABC-type glutathione transport system ATPase component
MSVRASQNPFRVEQVHKLPYQLQGLAWDELLDRCALANYRGAIVGAHGAGKTTLIIELARRLRNAGQEVTELFTNSDAGFALPLAWRNADCNSIVMGDGYDSLNIANRLWIRRRYTRLIVTSHTRCALPTLHICEARADVLAWAANELSGQQVSHDAADALLIAHNRNMRDVLRTLYDQAGQ